MPRLLRLLVCCLMALALPLQGMAAAVRLHCLATAGQGVSAPADGQAAVEFSAVHAPAAHNPLPPCHQTLDAAATASTDGTNVASDADSTAWLTGADAPADGTANSAAGNPADNPHRCSACAACSVGLALAPGLSWFPSLPAHSPWVSQAPAVLHSVALALPKRPPRAA